VSTHDPFGRYVLYILGELPGDEAAALAAQIEADAGARAELEAARQMIDELDAALIAPEGADPLADRIIAELDPRAPRRRVPAWRWLTPVAVAACLLVALGVWRFWPDDPAPMAQEGPKLPVEISGPFDRPDEPIAPKSVQFAGQWQITPTGKADFRVVEPTLVRLDRGELLVESTEEKKSGTRDDPEKSLRIETPHGEAVATGTRFYVGTHRPTEEGESTMLRPLTRVLVLSGVVTLTTALGSVDGTAGDLLAAEPDKAPTKLAVQANSDFAFQLYKQLAQENQGKNLFFSPYSVSGALAMTAEGARGETAAEMGKVLCFPAAARRVGDDAQRIPWETSLMHAGISSINERLMGGRDQAEEMAIRARIVELRKQLEAVKANISRLKAEKKWQEILPLQKREREIAAQLNAASAQVDQYEIRVANALWGEKTYPFQKEFIETVAKHYDTGGVFPVDFRNAFDDARLEINGWVEAQTNDRIKDIIPPGALDDTTRLVLTNAIYFKGEWATPFKAEQTKDRDFTLADGEKVKTPIMHAPNLEVTRYGAFRADGTLFDTPKNISRGQTPKLYPDEDGFAAVELPYKGDDLSMVVIAPNSPGGLAALEANLTSEKVSTYVEQLAKRKVHVFLPKFKMETDYTLGDCDNPATLQAMGMVRAFSSSLNPAIGADFSGMTTSTNPMDQLYISQVLHKAFVEVNEKGTEAAAATAVIMMMKASAPINRPFTPTFNADRPFLFLIRDKATGSVLFLGRMTQPAS
jgi:serpin B